MPVCILQEEQLVYANSRMALLVGLPHGAGEHGPVPFEPLVLAGDWPGLRAHLHGRLAGEAPQTPIRFQARHRDGHAVPLEVLSARLMFRGRPGLLLTGLHQSGGQEDRLHFIEQLLDAIPTPIFYKDEQGRYQGCNRAFVDSLGMARADIIGKTVYDLAPPDLAQRYDLADRELLQSGATQSYSAQVRYADGERRDVQFSKAVFRRRDGSLAGLVGVMLDISDLKQKEAELGLAARVFDASTEGIIITDADGRILRTNRAFGEITGYSEAECIGRTPAFIKSGQHDAAFYASLWRDVFQQGRWQGEIWNRRKNGEVYPAWLSISAARDEHGLVTNFIGISTDISRHKEAEAHINRLANYDSLTGLPNRTLLQDRLDQALGTARRQRCHVAVMLLDLDRLKQVNDSLGHASGDRIIQIMARRLEAAIGPQDTLCRHMGDQFALILTGLAESLDAGQAAERLLQLTQDPVDLEGQLISMTASVGISIFPDDGDDAPALLRNADTALHHAKEEGRNNFQFYRAEMNAASLERLVFEQRLRHALERQELEIHYQPQFELESGCLIGMEALLRWRHPDLGLVSPARFIPLAEETGLIVPIGQWVLEQACRQTAAWSRRFGARLRIAVNLSACQFQAQDLPAVVRAALEGSGLAPQQLELELTESTLMRDADRAAATLQQLKALGVQLAIDDFGTGYSSLAYLRRFPLDSLKIDRSFVLEMERDSNAGAITQAIIALGRSLGLQTVAEGIETPDQEAMLKQLDCQIGQGFLFSRPVPAVEMEAGLAGRRWPLPTL